MSDTEPKYMEISQVEIEKHLDGLLNLIDEAGAAIMAVYGTDFTVDIKDDDSPLTDADRRSHEIMVPALEAMLGIPVISEEDGKDKAERTKEVLRTARAYVVVDPLDGTREFRDRSGQFCPGFAVIVDGRPYFGMYSVPTQGVTYYGGPSMGSFKKEGDGVPVRLRVATESTGKVLGSRIDTGGPSGAYVKEKYARHEIISIGSMMKFGLIAEGKADAYPSIDRPLKLWDLAPGHAIVEGAGGIVTRPDGSPIDYRNTTLLAGDFVARAA